MVSRRFLLAVTGWLAVQDVMTRNGSTLVANAYPTVLSIPAYDEDCFMIRTPGQKPKEGDPINEGMRLLIGNYEILSDAAVLTPATVHVFIVDDAETVFYQSQPGKTRDNMQVPVTAGSRYWICIQNDLQHHYGQQRAESDEEARQNRRKPNFVHPDGKDRMVGFDWFLSPIQRSTSPADPEMGQYSQQWMASVKGMSFAMRDLLSHFKYMRAREATLRQIVETTFSEVFKWSMTEAFFVCLVAAGQVLYFRWFIESKSKGGGRYM